MSAPHRKSTVFLLLLTILISAVCFAACNRPDSDTLPTGSPTPSSSPVPSPSPSGPDEPDDKPVLYTVRFDCGGKAEVASVSVESGMHATEPADPVAAGFYFDGWFRDAAYETAWDWNTDTVTQDITLYAKWLEDWGSCIVKSTDDGFTLDNERRKVSAKVKNEQDSYSFMGRFLVSPRATWQLFGDKQLTQLIGAKMIPLSPGFNTCYIAVESGDSTQQTVYEAEIYRNRLYSYSFYAAQKSYKSGLLEEGSFLAEPEPPELQHYTFHCWLNEDGTEASFPVQITKPLRYDARFTPISYTVTYHDGYENTNPTSYTIEDAAIELSIPSRPGYAFGGWYDTPDFSGEATFAILTGSNIKGDIELYARWERATDGLEYQKNGTYYIAALGSATDADIIVPSFYNGYPVQHIQDFSDSAIDSILLPDSIETIGVAAFSGSSLPEIVIPASVQIIDRHAFSSSKLKKITFAPNSALKTIASEAFQYCKFTEISIPASVESIARDAFLYGDLEKIELPADSRLTKIENLFGSYEIKTLNVPAGVRELSVGYYAVCVELNGTALECLSDVSDHVYLFVDDEDLDYFKTTFPAYAARFYTKSTKQDFMMSDTVLLRYLGDAGEVTIPEYVEVIDTNAFYLSKVKSVHVTKNVREIRPHAFDNSLAAITFAEDSRLEVVGESSLGCSLKTVTFPASLKRLGDNFNNQFNAELTVVIFQGTAPPEIMISDQSPLPVFLVPEGAEEAYRNALRRNPPNALVDRVFAVTCLQGDYIISDGTLVRYLGDGSDIRIPDSVTALGDLCFYRAAATQLTIPKQIAKIGSEVFYYSELRSIDFEQGSALAEIADRAFTFCLSLRSITLPAVTTVGAEIFFACPDQLTVYVETLTERPDGWSADWLSTTGKTPTVVWGVSPRSHKPTR